MDGHLCDRGIGIFNRSVLGFCREGRNFVYRIERLVIHDLAVGCILTVQVGVLSSADEKLRSSGIWIIRSGRRQNAQFVRHVVELGVDLVSGSAGALSVGATALDHEGLDDPVKNQIIVVADFGQGNKVFHVPRSLVRKERQSDGALTRFQLSGVFGTVQIDGWQNLIDFVFPAWGHDHSPWVVFVVKFS